MKAKKKNTLKMQVKIYHYNINKITIFISLTKIIQRLSKYTAGTSVV